MEYTGRYYEPIAQYLYEASIFVSVINAILAHDYNGISIRKVKTDKIDAIKLANIALGRWTKLREYVPDDEIRQVTKTFTVRDTKEPKIVLASRSVEVDVGTSFDPYAVVSSVADPVDGALERLEEEPQEDGNGWYTMRGSYDPAVPGTYHLTLVACDRNGNRATKGINVIVRSSSSADPSEEEALDYVLNSNTGRFHRPSCGDAAAVSEGNRIDVHLTRDEVLAMGYAPCRHCNP
jgi:hypothetical protein